MVFVNYLGISDSYQVKDTDATILHAHTNGGYTFHAIEQRILKTQFSRFEGIHIPFQTMNGWSLCKTIHSFLPLQTVTAITKKEKQTILEYEKGKITLDYEDATLRLTALGKHTIPLIIDCREIYDFGTIGRHYTITKKNSFIVIEYKRTISDNSSDATVTFTDSSVSQNVFVVLKTNATLENTDTWVEANYTLEKKRNAGDDVSYLYHPVSIDVKDGDVVELAVGFSQDECIKKIQIMRSEIKHKLNASQNYLSKRDLALSCAQKSFSDLRVSPLAMESNTGLYAGLPWFYQFWSRDESISLGALILQKDYVLAKKILMRELSTINGDGLIANRYPHSDLPSADATGWMCKRFIDLLIAAPKIFTKKELRSLFTKIQTSILTQTQHRLKNGFIYSEPLETWMDTGRGYDERIGCRIEIQALYLVQLRLQKLLAGILGDEQYATSKSEEDTFAQNFRAAFFHDGIFHDGLYLAGERDATLRPNIFLVHYLYPQLFPNATWETIFDTALEALWLHWGGLSTIDKDNKLFCGYHTGQTNESYHRGDSWYWVNNLAALSLYNVNAQKYHSYYTQIIEASSEEILQYGSLGCHAEISDAAEQSSLGCYNQLWSNAMFIELVSQTKKK